MPIFWNVKRLMPTFWKYLAKFQLFGYNVDIMHEIIEILMNQGSESSILYAYGKSLKELRLHCNLTQSELSEKTKIPRQSLSVYERGEVAPTIIQAYRLAVFFGMDVSDFIEYGLNLPDLEFNDICMKYEVEHMT